MHLYREIGYIQKSPTTLYSNNQSAIAIAMNLQYHSQSKHFQIQNHHLQQEIQQGVPCLKYYLTNDMVADIFTKATPCNKHLSTYNTLA